MSVAGVYLELVKVAASAVCDFDLLLALVLGNKPLKGAVAHALHNVSTAKHVEGLYPTGGIITFTCWATESSMARGMMLLNYLELVRLFSNMRWNAQLLQPTEFLPRPAHATASQHRDVAPLGCVMLQTCCAAASMARV